MMNRMNDSSRVQYDVTVMARLRYPMPNLARPDDDPEVDPDVDDAVRDSVWDDRQRYAKELTDDYDGWVESIYLSADAEGEAPGPPPSVLAIELERVAIQLTTLETYRDRLLVYARSLASKPVTARALASRTGLSHSTIVRMTTSEAVADVATEAGPAAADVLADFDPRDDPQFYLRLQYAAHLAQDGER
jgi:hypothetical protein